jgi:hypothetical protein
MTQPQLLIHLHKNNHRQGPGSNEITFEDLEMTGLIGKNNSRPYILAIIFNKY